jgi:copper transport protein
MLALVPATPLDDFLNDSNSAVETGERLQQIGLFGSLFGLTLATGLIVFLTAVHRGLHREVAAILRIIAVAGGVAFVGAVIELAGVASIGDLSWSDALTDSTGSAPMMRLLGGLMITLGLFDHTVPAGDRDDSSPGNDEEPAAPGIVRWFPASASAFGFVGAGVGIMSFWFDGHTVTEGPRVVHALVDFAHVLAGSVWFGGIVGLVVLAVLRRSTGESIAPAVVRFSAIATVALVVVALAGSLMTLMILGSFGDLTGTRWGRILLVKVGAVAIAAAIGGYNHFVVVPALEAAETPVAIARRARTTVTVEAALLAFVVAMTVLLTTASIN